ncbi:hypothetical protein [Hymenobacter metallilatus]|uniref:hypothetical protein n=1 Tax=Hymenobacter metallilatus TaxID=2493666 RepID=UPI00163A34D1|nr:hypothetical protein [Hymenobacter metallilatus]
MYALFAPKLEWRFLLICPAAQRRQVMLAEQVARHATAPLVLLSELGYFDN